MATDTPNFNWPIPEDTDLVKDGAKAIRDLGNAIDTSAQDFGGGLVHINTTSFSAVSSQSINDVFSATYENYKILIYAKGSANQNLAFRFRASGSDDTGSVYDNALNYNITNTPTSGDDQNATFIGIGSTSTVPDKFANLDVFSPNVALTTGVTHQSSNYSASAQRGHSITTAVQTTTQYDGFSLIITAGTGNFTGSVSVYGYAKV